MYNIEEIRSAVNKIASTLPVSKIILVGSYANNTADENSDMDFVVDGEDLSESYWELLFSLEDAFGIKIDLMTLRGLQNSIIKESVLAGGILLYAK